MTIILALAIAALAAVFGYLAWEEEQRDRQILEYRLAFWMSMAEDEGEGERAPC